MKWIEKFYKTCYFLGPSEDKAVESSPEESEGNADEEDLSFEDTEGKKFWNRLFPVFISAPHT